MKGIEYLFTGMIRIDDIEMHASGKRGIQELTNYRILKIKNTGSYRGKSSGSF